MYNKLTISYSNNKDIENIINIFKSSPIFYSFENNILSFVSIFCDKKIITNAEFQLLDYKDNINKYINFILEDSIKDAKEFYDINTNINKNEILNLITSKFKSKLKKDGLLESIYQLYFEILELINNKSPKEIITLSIVIINNLLIFFGFYLKWDSIFENSFLGFWSEMLNLSFEKKENQIIKNKLIDHFLKHTRIYFMEPIFFDNNKNNKNINEKNIYIKIEVSKNKIDIDQLNDLYIKKLKKIDRTLLSICNNI